MQDLVYELLKKSKEKFYREKHKSYILDKITPFNNFLKINVMFDTETIGKRIGVTNLGHLMILLKTLELRTNEVDYSILNLSEDRKRKIKTLFKKEGLVKKVKLSFENESKYYFNPKLVYYGKGTIKELVEKFD